MNSNVYLSKDKNPAVLMLNNLVPYISSTFNTSKTIVPVIPIVRTVAVFFTRKLLNIITTPKMADINNTFITSLLLLQQMKYVSLF
jgi:hypothetical protein